MPIPNKPSLRWGEVVGRKKRGLRFAAALVILLSFSLDLERRFLAGALSLSRIMEDGVSPDSCCF